MFATRSSSRARLWSGRVITGLPVAFLLFDIGIKLASPNAPVAEAFAHLGWPVGMATFVGVLELVCLAIYLVPRTAVIGAVLFIGFLGGAIATHVRVNDPLFSHDLFPTYIAGLLWLGLYLRDDRVRALLRPARAAVVMQ